MVSGTVISISDASDGALQNLRIYGKTTQDGIPTPEVPVELVSVGDGSSVSVTVSDGTSEQTLIVSIPNGLLGIPVSSGGNYTDSTGQQWICDEVDFARGRLIKRVLSVRIPDDLKGGAVVTHNTPHPYDGISRFVYRNTAELKPGSVLKSDRFSFSQFAKDGEFVIPHGQVGQLNIQIRSNRLPTDDVAGLLAWAQDHPITILAQLAAPVETDLSEEELAAYAAMHTYASTTNISNDVGAWIDVGYYTPNATMLQADIAKALDTAKTEANAYTDSKRITKTATITTPWSGSAAPYTQTVSVSGILASDTPHIIPVYSTTNSTAITQKEAWACVSKAETSDGTVTFTCFEEKPTIEIPIQIEVNR